MTLVVTATPVPDPVADGRPSPSVDVLVEGVTGATINVWRSWDGQRVELRGAKTTNVLGASMFWTDYEAPFGIPVAYQATTYSSTRAAIESVQSANTELVVDDTWVSDPLSPSVATTVTLHRDSARTMTYRMPMQIAPVSGSAFPVAIMGTRQAAADVSLLVQSKTWQRHEEARNVLGSAGVVLFRQPAVRAALVQLPPLAYLAIGDLQANPVTSGLMYLTMTATLVAPPTNDIVLAARTCLDVLVGNTTCADVLANYPTCLDLLTG